MPIKDQYSELLKMTSPCEKLIRRDIARTYPEHEFFKEKDSLGQEVLFNVMKVSWSVETLAHSPDGWNVFVLSPTGILSGWPWGRLLSGERVHCGIAAHAGGIIAPTPQKHTDNGFISAVKKE